MCCCFHGSMFLINTVLIRGYIIASVGLYSIACTVSLFTLNTLYCLPSVVVIMSLFCGSAVIVFKLLSLPLLIGYKNHLYHKIDFRCPLSLRCVRCRRDLLTLLSIPN